ncbi:hypothetical protein WN48_10482 [Eufriesea mexicana]|uniref:CUB domain-containing protein n=1 Tax=Eufriesea mexicana TaxID=516756 RepID=A0A310SGG2_9HYME|nr:hypothetical protein WN48_10482 [Eufriesea mexicana]
MAEHPSGGSPGRSSNLSRLLKSHRRDPRNEGSPRHCTDDFIAVYSGPAMSSPLLKMLCGKDKTTLTYSGQKMLVEFRSGPEVPPFDYNGFVASLNFIEITTEAPTTVTMDSANRSGNHCTDDFIAVYSGPAMSSPLLKMLCGKDKTTLTYSGQKMLVEFRSGPEVPPFDYNGFVASLNFIEITTEAPTTVTMDSANRMDTTKSINGAGYNVRSSNRDLQDHRKDQGSSSGCDLEVNGEKVRAGHHDTRGKLKSTTCRLVLRGRDYDTGHVSLASYNLSAQDCQSSIEIFDGQPEGGMLGSAKSLERICSPAQRLPPEFVQQDTVTRSTGGASSPTITGQGVSNLKKERERGKKNREKGEEREKRKSGSADDQWSISGVYDEASKGIELVNATAKVQADCRETEITTPFMLRVSMTIVWPPASRRIGDNNRVIDLEARYRNGTESTFSPNYRALLVGRVLRILRVLRAILRSLEWVLARVIARQRSQDVHLQLRAGQNGSERRGKFTWRFVPPLAQLPASPRPQREGGTQQPASVCDVEYYGLTSLVKGFVVHPEPHRLFAMEGPIKCRQHFIPAANQSVIIRGFLHARERPRCAIRIVNDVVVVALPDWLPVGIRSWTPVYLEWSKSSKAGLNFRAAYEFIKDTYCGYHTTTKPEGEVNGGDLASSGLKLNQYYQQKCTWILDSLTDRQLTIEVKSTQSRPCTAWNLTIHEYSKNGDPAGPRLHTFCSRDTHKNFTLPWKTNTVVVRLQALGRTAPEYTMKWRSLSVIANTHKSGPSPAPNHVFDSSTGNGPREARILILFAMLLAYAAGC